MSQVIVTNDNLNDLRKKTRSQENLIKKDQFVEHWRLSDVSKPNPIMKLLAIPGIAIGLMFALILGLGALVWTAFSQILKALSSLAK